MSIEDKMSIMERVWAYLLALDALQEASALGSYFTKDAVWECYDAGQSTPSLRFTSSREVESALQAARGQLNGTLLKHHLTGLVFDVLNAERAVTRSKVLVTAQGPQDAAPQLRNTAECTGHWIKNERGWKLTLWSIRRDSSN